MNETVYVDLGWLPRPPEDFRTLCRDLEQAGDETGLQVRKLAGHALDENQLKRLCKAIEAARAKGTPLAPMSPFKLGIIGNATTKYLPPALTATAARFGLELECVAADFGQALQEALSPDSLINASKPDAVLIAVDHRGLPLGSAPGDETAEDEIVRNGLDYIETIRDGIRRHSNAVCIVQTVPRPVEGLFGGFDVVLPGTGRRVIDSLNVRLAAAVRGTEDVLFDVAGLAELVGLSAWHDPTLWNMAKIPFSNHFLPLYADHLCRILGAMRGKSRRCLILDLDNTLWGGVIGDDGVDGIVVGQGDPTGEAYLDVQKMALALRGRGVVLAVSSKNNDEIARGPFRSHPEMLLKENHIAVFQANWNDKPTNIASIAEELSLGLESMVFLDDNPVERGLVRGMLPMVAVPELPADPALYARTLMAAGYFEAVGFSDEDRKRSEFYQDNARRVALKNQAHGLGAYLKSLDMTITFRPFNRIGRARITQLINKSNQYNLTTRRYTEAQVGDVENDPRYFTLQVRLADIYGDNGMISVVICKRDGDVWDVHTWLMSCRVLGRKVEHATLQEILRNASQKGVREITGIYLPTERNKLVEDHYSKLGFSLIETTATGTTRWKMEVASAPAEDIVMRIVRLGREGQPADEGAGADEIDLKQYA
jgi:FkbH-like protein